MYSSPTSYKNQASAVLKNFQHQIERYSKIQAKNRQRERQKTLKLPSIYEKENKAIIDALKNKIQTFQHRIHELQIEKGVQKRVNKQLINYMQGRTNHGNYQPFDRQDYLKHPYKDVNPTSVSMNGSRYVSPERRTRYERKTEKEGVIRVSKNASNHSLRKESKKSFHERSKHSIRQSNKKSLHQSSKKSMHQKKKQDIAEVELEEEQAEEIKSETKRLQLPEEREKKKKLGKNLIRKFRIAAFAVLFSIFFPKFCRTVTINRFDYFCRLKNNEQFVHRNRAEIMEKIKQEIKKIYQEIKEKKQEAKMLESLKSQQEGDKSHKFVQFQFDRKSSMEFCKEFVTKIANFFMQSIQHTSFYSSFVPLQFIPNALISNSDVAFLDLHDSYGYSKYHKTTALYLLFKQIYSLIFIENNILEQLFKKHIKPQMEDDKQAKFFVLEMHLKISLFRNFLTGYQTKLENQLIRYPLPDKKLIPQMIGGQGTEHMPNLGSSTQISFDQNVIFKIVEHQLQKKKSASIEVIQKSLEYVYSKCIKNQRKVIRQIREISYHFRKQEDTYFYIKNRKKISKKPIEFNISESQASLSIQQKSRLTRNRKHIQRSSKGFSSKASGSIKQSSQKEKSSEVDLLISELNIDE